MAEHIIVCNTLIIIFFNGLITLKILYVQHVRTNSFILMSYSNGKL
jgi:hypothetical protein